MQASHNFRWACHHPDYRFWSHHRIFSSFFRLFSASSWVRDSNWACEPPIAYHDICEPHTNGNFLHWIPWGFSILRRSLHMLWYITATSAAISSIKLFSLGYCSLGIIYFSLQQMYWVLYLVFSIELDLVLEIVLLDLQLLHGIIWFRSHCAAIVLILQNINVVCKGPVIRTTIRIGF